MYYQFDILSEVKSLSSVMMMSIWVVTTYVRRKVKS